MRNNFFLGSTNFSVKSEKYISCKSLKTGYNHFGSKRSDNYKIARNALESPMSANGQSPSVRVKFKKVGSRFFRKFLISVPLKAIITDIYYFYLVIPRCNFCLTFGCTQSQKSIPTNSLKVRQKLGRGVLGYWNVFKLRFESGFYG